MSRFFQHYQLNTKPTPVISLTFRLQASPLDVSRDSSVTIVTRLLAGQLGNALLFPASTRIFSLLQKVQGVPGAHPTFCPVTVRGFIL
jgi:hypothetical protein